MDSDQPGGLALSPMPEPFDVANDVRRKPGRPSLLDGWTRYVPADEPKDITELWDHAAACIEAAGSAERDGDREAARDRMQAVYGCMRALRAKGLPVGTGWNARHGIPTSKLVMFGRQEEA
jgi:hypothetical protein